MIQTISFNNFNSDNLYTQYFTDIGEDTYIFTVRWSEYCDCAFLSINDYENNPIISGVALVNGLRIRNNNLPYVFLFTQNLMYHFSPCIFNISGETLVLFGEPFMHGCGSGG